MNKHHSQRKVPLILEAYARTGTAGYDLTPQTILLTAQKLYLTKVHRL